jgi:hypothetical protein
MRGVEVSAIPERDSSARLVEYEIRKKGHRAS